MIAKKSALVMMNTFIGATLGLIAIKLMARYFGREIVGEVEYAFGLLGILVFMTDLGIPTAHIKRVSEGLDEDDCFATFAVFKLVSTAAFVAVTLGILVYRIGYSGKPIQDTSFVVIILVMSYLVTNSLRQIFISVFDARRETARGQVTIFADTLVRVGVTIVVALVFAGIVRNAGPLAGRIPAASPLLSLVAAHPAESIAFSYALAGIVALAVAGWQARRSIRRGRFRWDIMRGYVAFALPVFLASSIGAVAGYTDRVALGYFGGATDTGAFGPLRRATQVLEAIPAAIALLLFPTISALDAKADRGAIRSTLRQSLRYTAIVMIPAVAFVAVFAPSIIHVGLSDEWLPSWPTLTLLAVYAFFVSITRPYLMVVIGMSRAAVAARVGLVMALVNILLNLILIPKDIRSLGLTLFGLRDVGAALATAISGFVGYLMLRKAAHELVGERVDEAVWRPVVAGLAQAVFLVGVDFWLLDGLGRWYHVVGYGLASGVVFLAVLWAMKGLTHGDLAMFRQALHPWDMLRYVRGELKSRR